MSCSWRFTPYRPGDRARESQVEKFFRNDSSTRATAVVREGIQNSLDAIIDGVETVHVRIRLGETSAELVAPYADGLFEHLRAPENRLKLHTPPEPGHPVRYLTFEDFNTRGLEGNPEQWEPKPQCDNPFFNFFRGEGVTGKSEGKRGRHGVGKMVFTVASRAHCIFGVTSTQTDGNPLLMGTSTLWQHHLHGRPYHPDGWFGEAKSVDGNELVVPVRDQKFIMRFCTTFGLERESLPGLSIVVPWLDDGFTPQDLLRAVVDGFFWSVIQGGLTVELIAEGVTLIVDRNTIDGCIERIDEGWQDVRGNVGLARWAISLKEGEIPTSLPPQNRTPKWTPDILPDDLLAKLRSALETRGRAALKVPTHVMPKRAGRLLTWFHIYLSRDDSCDEGAVRFIRRGLIIVDQRPKRVPAGYRALVVVEHEILSKFLGDAENPAHTQWLSENVRADYSFQKATIDFVVDSVPVILRALAGQQKQADPTLLLDLFYVAKPESPTEPARRRKPKEKPAGGESDEPDVKPQGKPKRFRIERRDNGFVIAPGDADAERPRYLDVRAAYGVRRGNAFKKYRPADFRLDQSPISIDVQGAKIITASENRLVVQIVSDDFRLHVTGFDTNRDLHLDPKVRDEFTHDGATT